MSELVEKTIVILGLKTAENPQLGLFYFLENMLKKATIKELEILQESVDQLIES